LKVRDNIHLVKDFLGEVEVPLGEAAIPIGENSTIVYLITGDTVTLIDAGITETPEKRIFPYLQELGLKPNQISMVILTHGHGDHYQGTAALKRISDVKIAIHELDSSLIEVDMDGELFRRLHSLYPYAFRAVRKSLPRLPKADIHLKDGDKLDLSGKTYEVLHIPGHTAGSIALYCREDGVLFTGDSIGGHFLLIYDGLDAYRNSIRRLMKIDIETMMMAHHYLPASGPVIENEEVRFFLEESLRTLDEKLIKAEELFEEAKEPLTLKDVERTLNVPTITAIKILEKLMNEGKIEEVPKRPLYW